MSDVVWKIRRPGWDKPNGYQKYRWFASGVDSTNHLYAAEVYANTRSKLVKRMVMAEDHIRSIRVQKELE